MSLAQDEIDKAIADFDQAIHRDPKSIYVHMFRGVAWARKREWDRALADFDGELRLGNSLRASCLQNRGNVLALAGRYTEAEAA
jgi:tetratricopeptide (TPR) repeat protein